MVLLVLVAIVIAMSHVDDPRVLDVKDIPTRSNVRVERDVSLSETRPLEYHDTTPQDSMLSDLHHPSVFLLFLLSHK